MTLTFNTFASVEHNQWRLPRIVFHLAHVALGVPLAFVGRAFGVSFVWLLVGAFVVQSVFKCLWIDWHRTSGQFLHWVGLHRHEPWDYASDVGLTMLGALLLVVVIPCPVAALAALYVLSVFNGT